LLGRARDKQAGWIGFSPALLIIFVFKKFSFYLYVSLVLWLLATHQTTVLKNKGNILPVGSDEH
jgi:hypothetical protein